MRLVEVDRSSSSGIDPQALMLARRVTSERVGLVARLNQIAFSPSMPAIMMSVPEMLGIHRQLGLAAAPQYHCAGMGLRFGDSIVRACAEAVERSATMTHHLRPGVIIRRRRRDVVNGDQRFVDIPPFVPYTLEQRATPGFPIGPVPGETEVVGWVRGVGLGDGEPVWLPAQAVMVGYFPRSEGRYAIPFTTGSAAHVKREDALSNALLELVGSDALIGHWYGKTSPIRVLPDPLGTPTLTRIFEKFRRTLMPPGVSYEFFRLPQPDNLPVEPVLCALRCDAAYPALVFGLGAKFDLERAMFHALIEAVSVAHLALLSIALHRSTDVPTSWSDADGFIRHYAAREHADELYRRHYADVESIKAIDLDRRRDVDERASADAFRKAMTERFNLVALDLTSPDVADAGLAVVRACSPDLLPLCLPALPPIGHPRFDAYGGISRLTPHPFP